MRNKIITGLLAAAFFVGAAPASASGVLNGGGTYTFLGGVGGLQFGEALLASFNTGSTGGVTGTYQILTGSGPSGADPANSIESPADPYLSVLGGGNAVFNFVGGIAQLGLDYGSADSYNSFQIFFADGTNQILTGQNIINVGLADGNQSSTSTNGRLTFLAGSSAITGLTLTSGQNSLESDTYGVIAAVPEPSTWAMMLFGFGFIGFSMRRRPRRLLQAA